MTNYVISLAALISQTMTNVIAANRLIRQVERIEKNAGQNNAPELHFSSIFSNFGSEILKFRGKSYLSTYLDGP
jgi:Na+/H+ antiporter NhaD/arsenite permease-like protein